ncbi:MAG: hypothetical protein KatS3mg103_0420 [Phycisphaerales bacterium]|nr:MAG: hypothetical protein KatS3mg103_0420 [Phycisphaerales bacterium]
MRQRIGIAQALVNDPQLVILDEPTDGVDPAGRRDIRAMLQVMRDQGRTVFINSHLLGELELVCDAVAIMHQGQVVSMGSLDQLTSGLRRYEIVVEHPQPKGLVPAVHEALRRAAQADDRAPSVAADGPTITIASQDARRVQPAIDALRASGVTITAVRLHRPSLEDLFMQAIEHDASPGAALDRAAADRRPGRRPGRAGPGRDTP